MTAETSIWSSLRNPTYLRVWSAGANFIFGVLIGATPALLPVVGLKALHLGPLKLGSSSLVWDLGIDRRSFRPRAREEEAYSKPDDRAERIALAISYALMAIVRQHPRRGINSFRGRSKFGSLNARSGRKPPTQVLPSCVFGLGSEGTYDLKR